MFSNTILSSMTALKTLPKPILDLGSEILIQPTHSNYFIHRVKIYSDVMIFYATNDFGQKSCVEVTEFNFPEYIKKPEDLKSLQSTLRFKVQEIEEQEPSQGKKISFRLKIIDLRFRLLGGGGCHSTKVKPISESPERLIKEIKNRIDKSDVAAVKAMIYEGDRSELLFHVITGPCQKKFEMMNATCGEAKINFDKQDSSGKTLLTYAVFLTSKQCTYTEMLLLINFLLEKGANFKTPVIEKQLVQISNSKELIKSALDEKLLDRIKAQISPPESAAVNPSPPATSVTSHSESMPLERPISPDISAAVNPLKITIPPTPRDARKIIHLSAADITSPDGLLAPPKRTKEKLVEFLPPKIQYIASPTEPQFSTSPQSC